MRTPKKAVKSTATSYKLAWAPHLELSKSFKGFSLLSHSRATSWYPRSYFSPSQPPFQVGRAAEVREPGSALQNSSPILFAPVHSLGPLPPRGSVSTAPAPVLPHLQTPPGAVCASTITSHVSPYLRMSHVRVGESALHSCVFQRAENSIFREFRF